MGVIVEIEERGDRVAFLPGPVDHAVQIRAIVIVGPTLEEVADIDDERSRDEGRADPLAITLLQLKATDRIL